MTLHLKLDSLNEQPPEIGRPECLIDWLFSHSDQSIKLNVTKPHFVSPKIASDLSDGFDKDKPILNIDETHKGRLEPLISALEHISSTVDLTKVNFITWRGVLTALGTAGCLSQSSFDYEVVLVQNTIFIVPTQDNKDANRTLRDLRFEYFGRRFEEISVRQEAEYGEYDYCQALKTRVGNYRCIIGAEIDCFDENEQKVELKTSRKHNNGIMPFSYINWKLPKFWLQSFLADVPLIIVGFRDDKGILRRLEHLRTKDIPRISKASGQCNWDSNQCLKDIHTIFKFIHTTLKKNTSSNSSPEVYQLSKEPNSYTLKLEKKLTSQHRFPDLTRLRNLLHKND